MKSDGRTQRQWSPALANTIAEPVIARKKFNVDNFTVHVFEEEDKVTVYLTDLNQPSTTRGGGGLNVEISKKSKKVLRTYYSR